MKLRLVFGTLCLSVGLVAAAFTNGSIASASQSALRAQATGTPITIGTEGDGLSPGKDDRPQTWGEAAAVAYINAHGGLHGHKILIKNCYNNVTPSGATNCDDAMAQAKVAAVDVGVSGEADAITAGLQKTGIPLVFDQAGSPPELSDPNVYMLADPIGQLFSLPGPYLKQHGVKQISYVVVNIPGALAPTQGLGPSGMKAKGVTADVVAIAPGTPDQTPQISAELSKGSKGFIVIGDPPFCSGTVKAMHSLGFTGPVLLDAQCLGPTTAKASGPGGLKGTILLTDIDATKSGSDAKTFYAAMQKYEPSAPAGLLAATGYQSMMTLLNRLNSDKTLTTITPAAIANALKTAPPTALVLGHGIKVTCDGTAETIGPNICSKGTIFQTLGQNGDVVKSVSLSG